MSLSKNYLKSRPACKVKFIAPKALAESAKKVFLAGEFNGWEYTETPLRRQKNGDYTTTVELSPGAEYQYRYVLDGERWENDHEADKYVPSNVCYEDNSVVVV